MCNPDVHLKLPPSCLADGDIITLSIHYVHYVYTLFNDCRRSKGFSYLSRMFALSYFDSPFACS